MRRAVVAANDSHVRFPGIDSFPCKVKRPECPACDKAPVVRPVQEVDSERCHLCWDTLEVASEICALYLGTCNTCALICLSTAALAFGNCMERWCEPQPNPYYNND